MSARWSAFMAPAPTVATTPCAVIRRLWRSWLCRTTRAEDATSLTLLLLNRYGHTKRRGSRCIGRFYKVDADNALLRLRVFPGREIEPDRAACPSYFAARDCLGTVVVIPIAHVFAVNNGNGLAGAVVVMDLVLCDLG